MYVYETLGLAFPSLFLILLIVSAVVSSVGFIKFIYFISVGYGLAVSALAITLGIADFYTLSVINAVQLVLLTVYGIRLGGFLLIREMRSADYKRQIDGPRKSDREMSFSYKAAVWLTCTLLYVAQTSPALYRAIADKSQTVQSISFWSVAGVVLIAAAIFMEAASDHQKSKAKEANPKRFCSSGLFEIVRCPNYFAEILFWTALVISSADSYKGWAQLAVVLFGYICIFYIMLSSTKRLEAKQNRTYCGDAEYKKYIGRTPILFPFVPVKTLQNLKFIK